MKIFNNILETIGNIPLVRILKLSGHIAAKPESVNPLSSVKDRIGIAWLFKDES